MIQQQIGEHNRQAVPTTTDREFRYFDRLPYILRQEIANAPYDFSAEQIYEHWSSWRQENWFFTPDDDEYLEIMRGNFQRTMIDQTPREIQFLNYHLRRRQNVPRKGIQAIHERYCA